ncbi:ribonuclease III [Serpentinicella alkaliphila]|uniref:Ribonuclease 3 n=1 Tax=Serpentinicella alkaliphila TaxID=1734049 RepID=A0A4R2TQF9_9FIRM|nr:RNAse III [Serpentinicella alkaliphila]
MILDKNFKKGMEEIQIILNHSFSSLETLQESLIHSSYANETKGKSIRYNERLEFLGDSVLGLIVSDYIFKKYKHLPEGELTKVRANVVCEPSLANIAKKINLGKYLLLGRGEENTGGRNRDSILADAFEAIIGALYIDGGIEVARGFIISNLAESIELASKGSLFRDYKTHLQELMQSKSSDKITYNVVNTYGPDHDKTFDVEVVTSDKVIGTGRGKSKKEAEQNAAKQAIERVNL